MNDLEVLFQHYGAAKVVDWIEFKPPVDACKQEFPMFKQLGFHLYSSMSIHELWKVIASKHAEYFQAFLTLSSVVWLYQYQQHNVNVDSVLRIV